MLRLGVHATSSRRTPTRRGVAHCGGALLMAGTMSLLDIYGDFARYAATGWLWANAEGTVVDTRRTVVLVGKPFRLSFQIGTDPDN
jgi:hypothetical protein